MFQTDLYVENFPNQNWYVISVCYEDAWSAGKRFNTAILKHLQM